MADISETLRACIYTRVSTDKQLDGFGLDIQKEKCEQMIKFKDWELTQIYTDEGISGTKGPEDRPGLKQLIKDGEDHLYDVVVFYSLDRLGRKASLILNLVTKFNDVGLKIVSCKESLDTSSPNGRFFVGMLSLIAELERDTICGRLRAGSEQRQKKDGERGGSMPYGYLRTPKGIEINLDQEDTVKTIFKLREEGLRQQQIVDHLNSREIVSAKGGKWNQSMISKILKRVEIYKGGLRNDNRNGVCWPKIIE